jgi:heme-degrading monooxygenase HmoA
MVLEIATFDIRSGAEEEFSAAVRAALALVAETPGHRWARMTRGVETPSRFVLIVEWDSVEAHQAFRDSDRFPRWRAAIGPHFAAPPFVEHYADV